MLGGTRQTALECFLSRLALVGQGLMAGEEAKTVKVTPGQPFERHDRQVVAFELCVPVGQDLVRLDALRGDGDRGGRRVERLVEPSLLQQLTDHRKLGLHASHRFRVELPGRRRCTR